MTEENKPVEEKIEVSEQPAGEKKEKKEKKKRLKGLAGMISGILTSVNTNKRFKRKFAEENLRFVIVATDMLPAALVIINKGVVEVEAVELDAVKKTKKDGLLQGTMKQIMDIATRKLDPKYAWFHRQVKIRGPRKLLKLTIVFHYVI